jgi:hypothetical protein
MKFCLSYKYYNENLKTVQQVQRWASWPCSAKNKIEINLISTPGYEKGLP